MKSSEPQKAKEAFMGHIVSYANVLASFKRNRVLINDKYIDDFILWLENLSMEVDNKHEEEMKRRFLTA